MPALGRQLVVDADIAQSAGVSLADRSRLCRELLNAIRASLHIVVLSRQGEEEWLAHRSIYSATWFRAMEVSGQVVRVEGRLPPEVEVTVLEQFESARQPGVAKDLHLIGAALETDRIVLSNDDRARRAMRDAAALVPDIATIHWANPTNVEEDAAAWVTAGATDEPSGSSGSPGS